MTDAIHVEALSKRFRLPRIPLRSTIKDFAIGTMRREGKRAVVEAINQVTFSLEAGSMLGVIGRNGSGKSTLMRLLAGVLHPDAGSVAISGTVAPLLTLGAGFHPDLTGREGVRIELLARGLSRAETDSLLPEITRFSEIGEFIDAPVRTYSMGMMTRLAFSVATCVDPDVLLLDEILAVGDEAFARKCLARIGDFRTNGKTIVLVTHSCEIMQQWCDVSLWLDRGEIGAFGEPHTVSAMYRASAAGA